MNAEHSNHSSPAERHASALAAANSVLDPCGGAQGIAIGLVDMGIVNTLAVTGSHVHLQLSPTFPGCLFLGLFEEELEARILGLPWCTDVSIELSQEDFWDEGRMTPIGAQLLRQARQSTALPPPARRVMAPIASAERP